MGVPINSYTLLVYLANYLLTYFIVTYLLFVIRNRRQINTLTNLYDIRQHTCSPMMTRYL